MVKHTSLVRVREHVTTLMNVFWLYWLNYKANAEAYCDVHVRKIALEIAQMLFAAHHVREGGVSQEIEKQVDKVYRLAHKNHPLTIWIRSNILHYIQAAKQGMALCKEHTARYGTVLKVEKAIRVLLDNPPPPNETFDTVQSVPPQCIGKQRERIDTGNPEKDLIQAYRMMYYEEKSTQNWFKYGKIPSRVPQFLIDLGYDNDAQLKKKIVFSSTGKKKKKRKKQVETKNLERSKESLKEHKRSPKRIRKSGKEKLLNKQ